MKTKEDFLNIIQDIVSKYSKNIKIQWDDSFTNHAIDSLDVMRAVLELEQKLSISFDDDDLKDVKSPHDLYNLYCKIEK